MYKKEGRVAFNLRPEYIWLACGVPEEEIGPEMHHIYDILQETQYIPGEITPADGYVILHALEIAAIVQTPTQWLIFHKLYEWVTPQQPYPSPQLRHLARQTVQRLYNAPQMRQDWHEMVTHDYMQSWQDIGLRTQFDETWTWNDMLDNLMSRL